MLLLLLVPWFNDQVEFHHCERSVLPVLLGKIAPLQAISAISMHFSTAWPVIHHIRPPCVHAILQAHLWVQEHIMSYGGP